MNIPLENTDLDEYVGKYRQTNDELGLALIAEIRCLRELNREQGRVIRTFINAREGMGKMNSEVGSGDTTVGSNSSIETAVSVGAPLTHDGP